jgi:hypothetical protein
MSTNSDTTAANPIRETIEESQKMSILDKEMKKISKARVNILRSVEAIIYDPDRDQDSIREAATDIRKNCGIMSDQIIIGTDAVAESLLKVKDASDYAEWQHTLKDAARVTSASSRLLGDHVKTVENPEIRESIAYARGALDTTEQVALEQRRRGVIVSLNGPLAEYALHDGRMMGIIGNPEKEELGVVIGKAENQVVLRREDQTLVAVPVPDPSIYRRVDVGEAISLVAHERGDYVRNMAMEKQVHAMTGMVQRNNLANAFVKVNDEATTKALAQAKAQIGDAAWKQGHTPEAEKIVRAALKERGASYETQLSGKLTRVSLAETEANGAKFQKLRVTLENDGGKTILSADLGSEFAQRLIAKLDRATQEQPGQTVTIGSFAETVERDGKSFVNHVATLKNADGKEIQAMPGHFERAKEAITKAQEPLIASGVGGNKAILNNIADATRQAYFAEVVRGMSNSLEKQEVNTVEAKKQEYPRLEAHLKAPDKTWHSASLYQDREGHPRGSVAIENREKGVQEKHLVVYTEKVSEKTGEKFLSAKIDREDGKQLFVTIMPHEKNGERWLAASFAERDREKEKGHQLTPITGKGGELKPNAALLEKADVDRTAKYVRETFKVDPVQAHQRSVERKSSGLGLGVAK